MSIPLDAQLRILRVAVEAEVGIPSQILITSASEKDDASGLALGLASAFGASGRKTALMRLESDGSRNTPLGLRLAELKAQYDVCIVEGPPMLTSSASLDAARVVDGVMLVVGLGRHVIPRDHEVVPVLTRIGARLLGIVATAQGCFAQLGRAGSDFDVVGAVRKSPRVVVGAECESGFGAESAVRVLEH